MKKSLLTIAAALALVSCSQDELLPNGSETVANGKIGANIFVPTTTRGAALNTVEDLISSQNGFDLVSYYNLEDTYTEFMGTTDDGIQFKHDGSAWDYADRGEIHFWQSVPDEATDMKFFAVSPTKENLPTDASYSIGTDAQTITYTVPTEVSEQKDLMFAQTDLEDGEYEPTSEVYRNGVPLNFHHALSQIVFKARIADKEDTDGDGTSNYVKAYVNSVSVKNVHGAGTFDMNAASAILGENYYEDGDLDGMDYDNTLWTPSDNATKGYIVSELTNNAEITWIEAEDLTNGAIGTETAMLLLPQQLVALDLSSIGADVNSANEEQITSANIDLTSAGAYLEVNCRVEYTNNAGEVTYIVGADADSYANIYIPISTNWQPGYKYVYTLIFSADSGDPVKAIVESVDEWNTAEEEVKEDEEDNEEEAIAATFAMQGNKLVIKNAADLALMRDLVNSDAKYEVKDGGAYTIVEARSSESTTYSYRGADYIQTGDIDLNDVLMKDGTQTSWIPIKGTGPSNCFTGTFDVAKKYETEYYTISNLYIGEDLTDDNAGLFGEANGSSFSNIHIVSCNISGKHAAAIVAAAYQCKSFINCVVGTYNANDAITGTAEAASIAAYITGSPSYTNCKNYANIKCDSSASGIGNSEDGSVFTSCYNYGNVNAGTSHVGAGIASQSPSKIVDCHNYGVITADKAVGIAYGFSTLTEITASHNEGEIKGNYAGAGICYSPAKSLTITACYNIAKITGTYYNTGIVAYVNPGNDSSPNVFTLESCYNTGECKVGLIDGYRCTESNTTINVSNCYYLNATNGYQDVGSTPTECIEFSDETHVWFNIGEQSKTDVMSLMNTSLPENFGWRYDAYGSDNTSQNAHPLKLIVNQN